jgi:spore coat protein H
MRINKTIIGIGLVTLLPFSSCFKEQLVSGGEGLDDWGASTHSAYATPDYNTVFPQNAVNRLDIAIDKDYWEMMEAQLADILEGSTNGNFTDENPIYVPCQVFFNDVQWYNVGIRYKGNSSLNSTYEQGNGKLPLRLEFDYFEDDYPEITGQTFYGFTEFSVANNFDDKSLIREKMATDVYHDFGVPAPETAFYRIYVDYGDGPVYFGLYTMIEVIFDTMLDTKFGSSSGNCYKPDGDGASFADGTFDAVDFANKTNSSSSDWSDIEAVFTALNSATRTSTPTQWRSDLEAVFDVDGFLKYLAANTTFQNWDTYGRMTHNYYLYHDPADDLIKWIPWDNNEAFQEGKQGGSVDFDFEDVTGDWPLMTYLYADPIYKAVYDQYIDDFINGTFSPSTVTVKYQYYHNLIEPYVTGSDGETSGYTFTNSSDFSAALSDMISHASERYSAADAYLN